MKVYHCKEVCLKDMCISSMSVIAFLCVRKKKLYYCLSKFYYANHLTCICKKEHATLSTKRAYYTKYKKSILHEELKEHTTRSIKGAYYTKY